jgi:hypothetical protein
MPKDTREIARKAVQDEFRRQKKKHKPQGNDSSDDEGGTKKKKGRGLSKRESNEEEEPPAWESNYRDRAKERREGKPVEKDDEEIPQRPSKGTTLLDDVLEDEDTKAGQPIHGLDRSLLHKEEKSTEEPSFVATREEALEWLASRDSVASSALGRELVPVLRQIYLPVESTSRTEPSAAGLTVQRTTLFFTTTAIPGDTARAWQIPRQEIASSSTTQEQSAIVPKASPIGDAQLLGRLQQVLDQQQARQDKAARAVERVESAAPGEVDDDEDIFQMDDDDQGTSEPVVKQQPGSTNEESKPRKSFFFHQPSEVEASAEATPVVTKLQGLSERFGDTGVEDDYEVDLDGRLDDEGDKKKKKKKKRKKRGDDDSE